MAIWRNKCNLLYLHQRIITKVKFMKRRARRVIFTCLVLFSLCALPSCKEDSEIFEKADMEIMLQTDENDQKKSELGIDSDGD